MTEEQGYTKRKTKFQDQLLNLNPRDQPQMHDLQTLWSETFPTLEQSTPPVQSLAQKFQKKKVSQGSSNMVQVVDVVNDGIKEKVAVRISKKNGYFNFSNFLV